MHNGIWTTLVVLILGCWLDMLYESVGSRHTMIGGMRTDMDVEGCQTNLMLLEHEANKCEEDSINMIQIPCEAQAFIIE